MDAKTTNPLGAVISKAWSDEAFKARLLANPTATLKEEGIEVPAGFEIHAVENTDTVYNLVIPAKPKVADPMADVGNKSFCPCALLLDWTGLLQ